MYSYNSVIREIDTYALREGADDIVEYLDFCNEILEDAYLTEEEYNKVVDHLKLEILDIDRFVKVNGCEEVTNPVFFARNNIPTDDGLMSNKIFGITKDDRAGIFAYIDLKGWFIDPSCYKAWIRIDSKVKGVVHGLDTYSVNNKGEIVPDPSGSNGTEFLRKNIHKIKFTSTGSIKRDMKIQYLEKNRDKMFINKYIVIPPFYRDTNSTKGSVGVSGVNVLYRNLILAVRGLQSTQDYGFDQSSNLIARIQETLLSIYDWFAGNSNKANESTNIETGMGISGKLGIMRMANMSKTANYSSRMVIASPPLKTHSVDTMMVNLDYTALPLAACLADYRPFIQFNVRRMFENEFVGNEQYPAWDDNGEVKYVHPVDPLIEFSDERIKREMDRFLHGYNNRLVAVEFPANDGNMYYMGFKGRWNLDKGNNAPDTYINRKLTWCDVFYQAACEAVKDKCVLITRYPMDSYFNQITTKIVVSSTNQTEPMYVDNTYYPYYPYIRDDLIGSNTGNMFVDTLKMSNLYLKGLGADYDGDTVTAKGPYTIEANAELDEFRTSKANFIDLGASNIRNVDADCVNSTYALTKILSNGKKLSNPTFA